MLVAALPGRHLAPGEQPGPGTEQPEGVLAFLGNGDVVRSAWSMNKAGPERVDFPTSVKVVGHVDEAGTAHVLLTSSKILDQPGGLFGVAVFPRRAADDRAVIEADLVAFARARTLDDVRAAIDQRWVIEEGERNAFFAQAGASPEALAKSIAPQGLDRFGAYQDTFLTVDEHLDVAGLAGSAGAARLLDLVRDAARGGDYARCFDGVCEARRGEARTGSIVLERHGATLAIHGYFAATDPPPGGPPRGPLPAATKPGVIAAVLRHHVVTAGAVLGEAPLGPTGTVGVALTDLYEGGGLYPTLVVADGAHESVSLLDGFVGNDYGSEPGTSATFEVAFLDADGDGRTDVILRRRSHDGSLYTRLYETPGSLQRRPGRPSLRHDLDVTLAPTLDAAVKAALAPPVTVTPREACALLHRGKTPAGLRAVAVPGAPLLIFTSPPFPTLSPTISPLAAATAAQARALDEPCDAMTCSGAYCAARVAGPGSEHYWFRRSGKALRLAGVALYGGS